MIVHERVPEGIAEEFVDVPVSQIQEEIVEVTQIIPKEGIVERIVEQNVDVPVVSDSRTKCGSREDRGPDRPRSCAAGCGDSPRAPVVMLALQERVEQRTDIPVPPILDETVCNGDVGTTGTS